MPGSSRKTAEYNGEFVLKNNEFFADTTDSEKVYYRLSEKEAIKKQATMKEM